MIICEIGQNFCADMNLAYHLIGEAKEHGGDLVKFQLYEHAVLYKDHPEISDSSLTYRQAKAVFDYGRNIGIEVFFSVFDTERVEWCEQIGVKYYKIAAHMRDKSVWKAVAKTTKPTIISLASDDYSQWAPYGIHDSLYLYCKSDYPAEIHGFPDFGQLYIGFSDHTIGLNAAKVALARDARVIEKHFAIDHNTGVDAKWSMTPDELAELKRWEAICQTVL